MPRLEPASSGRQYSIGATPLDAGTGIPMSGTFGGLSAGLGPAATASVGSGALTYWVRGRDGTGSWSEASPLSVPTIGATRSEHSAWTALCQ
jgi:hypothetical protein